MQQRLMTEAEWRQKTMSKRRPDGWGAQCYQPFARKKRIIRRIGRSMLIPAAMLLSALMPLLFPMEQREQFADYSLSANPAMTARRVSAIHYQLPVELDCQQQTFTRQQLLGGKMMLISDQYPMPQDLLPANTASIAQRGNGMVPVRALSIRTGYETIDALHQLFEALKERNVQGLYVSQGMISLAQQRANLTRYTRTLMKDNTIQNAVQTVLQTLDHPGTGSLLQEYAVEIHSSADLPLEAHSQGQTLLQLCWRFGFVRESDHHPNRFRYVGKAHAAAMTYLDLDFENYLSWMHQKGVLVIMSGGHPQYVILCKPMQGDYASFDLPADAAYEVSMDNTGYALAACILSDTDRK